MGQGSDQRRIEYETTFHNDAFDRLKARQISHRLVDGLFHEAAEYFYSLVREECQGKEALSYGCGEGSLVRELLSWAATKVTAIDISPGMIERASSVISEARVDFRVMDCEEMEFPDRSFDLVVGTAILHHLDVEKAGKEITRVLRPGGRAVFLEPLGHNIFVNLFRRLTPEARTPFEHPLKKRDIVALGKIFRKVETREFVLTGLSLIPLRLLLSRQMFGKAIEKAASIDRRLQRFSATRYWCWLTVLDLHK